MLFSVDEFKKGQELEIKFDSCHPEYKKLFPVWCRNRDAADGNDAIKARSSSYSTVDAMSGSLSRASANVGGTAYLPMLGGQKRADYVNYRERAQWYGATEKTVTAFAGLIYRKNPTVIVRNEDKTPVLDFDNKFFDKVTVDGLSAMDLSKFLTDEIITVNKIGAMLDFPTVEGIEGMSQAEYEEKGYKAYIATYKAETITNWGFEFINGEKVPSFYILQENSTELNRDSMEHELVVKYRVLSLCPQEDETFIYKQMVVQMVKSKNKQLVPKYTVLSITTPLKNGAPLDRIPLYTMSSKGIQLDGFKQPVIDALTHQNIGHFRNSADRENELHWVGIKTAIFPGHNQQKHGTIRLGNAMTCAMEAKPFILESSSDSGLDLEMKNKETRMAILGAQLLSQNGRYASSVETSKIKDNAESSVLADIAKTQSATLSMVLTLQLEWTINKKYVVDMELNSDFYDDVITGDGLIKWMGALQQGAISYKTFFYNMKRRELFSTDWTEEEELAELEKTQEKLLNIGDEKYEELVGLIEEMKAKYSGSPKADGAKVAAKTIRDSSTVKDPTKINNNAISKK